MHWWDLNHITHLLGTFVSNNTWECLEIYSFTKWKIYKSVGLNGLLELFLILNFLLWLLLLLFILKLALFSILFLLQDLSQFDDMEKRNEEKKKRNAKDISRGYWIWSHIDVKWIFYLLTIMLHLFERDICSLWQAWRPHFTFICWVHLFIYLFQLFDCNHGRGHCFEGLS